MFDRFIAALLPGLYKLVKRHRWIRDRALRIWNLLSVIRAKIRRFQSGSTSLKPPSQFESTSAWVEAARLNSNGGTPAPEFRYVYPAETMTRELPGVLDKTVLEKFRAATETVLLPEAFIAVIPQGRVWGPGYVVTPDDVLLEDVSRVHYDLQYLADISKHPLFQEKEIVPSSRIHGRVAVLAAFGGRGFYHWMYDVLPRLELLRAGGLDLNSIDKFYVNECIARFHTATLAALGIGRERILQSHWVQHVQADELWITSHVGEIIRMPTWACGFLRQTLGSALGRSGSVQRSARIYLTRKSTHRRLSNEEDIIRFLKSAGFMIVAAEDFSMAEQVELFSTAEVIVALHGAGLANLVFCEVGTRVIEIFHPQSISFLYWTLSHQAGLKYFCLTGERTTVIQCEGAPPNQQDIRVDADVLRDTLELAGII